MAHHRYQTEAIVLDSAPRGESNRSFFLLTKDFGFIGASAQGVRALSSKLKGGLSDFSHTRVDLIFGEDTWRIVDAEEEGEPFSRAPILAQQSFARFSSLLRRLLHGERTERRLFSDVLAFRAHMRARPYSERELHDLEIIMAVKTLFELGYGGGEKEVAHIYAEDLSDSLLAFAGAHRRALVLFVRGRVRESHL